MRDLDELATLGGGAEIALLCDVVVAGEAKKQNEKAPLAERLQPLEDFVGLKSVVGVAKAAEFDVFRPLSFFDLVSRVPNAALELPFAANL